VDLDLESFFDRVNHDRLLHRLGRHVDDQALLRLITAFLKAGAWVDGQHEPSRMGVPQGGPLSPVLANVVLDEMDWELCRRGHRFARYADDCNIAVKSERAGQRVMHSVTRWIEDSLRLTVNSRKSAVDRPWNRKFLGFTLSRRDKGLKVADTAIDKLKDRVRELSRRTRGQSLSQIVAESYPAWLESVLRHHRSAEPSARAGQWIRRRLRCYAWKQWGPRGYRELRKRGVSVREAWNVSKSAHGAHGESRKPRHYRWRCQRVSSAQWACQNWRQPGPDAHAFNAANRRVRDPYARWCGREGP
jgi:group II intron reverse transcriptase/maturase